MQTITDSLRLVSLIKLATKMTPSGIIVLCVLKCSLSIPLSQFYPFGNGTTDNQLPKGDETTSPAITLQGTYTFYGQQRATVIVSSSYDISYLV